MNWYRSEVSYIDRSIELLAVVKGVKVMRMAMDKNDFILGYTRKGNGRLHNDGVVRLDDDEPIIVEDIHIADVDLVRELSVFSELDLGVMVAADKRDAAVEAGEDFAYGLGEAHDEIAEDVNLIIRRDRMIPANNHVFSRLPGAAERAVAVCDDIFVVEVVVGCEKDHFTPPLQT